MTVKYIISALALVSAMGVSSAIAQDQINGMPVPADQMQAVHDKCDELNNADGDASAGAAGAETPAAGAEAGAAGAAGAGAAGGEAGAAAGADANAGAAGQIDLDTLTLEMCQEGGFVSSSP